MSLYFHAVFAFLSHSRVCFIRVLFVQQMVFNSLTWLLVFRQSLEKAD